MIRGNLILIAVGLFSLLCGCRSNGLGTASNGSPSARTFDTQAQTGTSQDSHALAQSSKSRLGSRSVGFGKSKSSDQKSSDVKTAGLESRQSSRAPTVKPAVHSSDPAPDPEIPAGEAATAATQPQGNFLSRMLPGKKEPAKRMQLPLAEGSSAQATNDEMFGGL